MNIKALIRKLQKKKTSTLINITGLTLGIASAFYILVFVMYEFSYDKFHAHYDSIYRINEIRSLTEKPRQLAVSCPPIATVVQNKYPEIVTTRLLPYHAKIYIEEKIFDEKKFFFTEQSMLDIFDFQFIDGDKKEALLHPFSVVITESIARKYFGTFMAVGKAIKFNNKIDLTVTGVVKDWPENTHIKIDMMASLNSLLNEKVLMEAWWETNFYTYVLLPSHLNTKEFRTEFPKLVNEYVKDGKGQREFVLQPLADIHLHSALENEVEKNSDIKYVYILIFVGIFILAIACFNFMNLSTATFTKVSKEVGVRKVFGAKRKELSLQFLGESVFISLLSFIISIVFVELTLSQLDNYLEGVFAFYISNRIFMYGLFFLIALLVGIIAGSYPAFYLPSFKPSDVFKKKIGASKKSLITRNALIIGQFVIASAMISATLIIYKQMKFIQNMDVGFDKNHLLVLNIPGQLTGRHETVKNMLKKHPDILSVTVSGGVPGDPQHSEFPYQLDNVDYKGNLPNILTFMVDYEFVETYGLKIIAGRSFEAKNNTDKDMAFMLNEKAASMFGWDDPIGKPFTLMQFNGKEMETKKGRIIGVVKDFNFKSLHSSIEPLVLEVAPADFFYTSLSIRYKEGSEKEVLNVLKKQWEQLAIDDTMDYYFLHEKIALHYKGQQNLKNLMYLFTFLSIVLACLGLFGLVSFSLEQRSKEIGIRKVFGSMISNIIWLLYKQYFKLVILANIIAIPITILWLNKWLQLFAYKIHINWSIFIFTMIGSFVFTLLTITTITYKKASDNPSVTLKYE